MDCCSICKNKNAQYKCPKCRIKYCSANCFQTHQNNDCNPIKETPKEETQNDNTHITEDTIPKEKLNLLGESNELKDILKNKHIRDILLEVDKNKNAADIMERAMKEPIFVEFADICLKIVQDESKLCNQEN